MPLPAVQMSAYIDGITESTCRTGVSSQMMCRFADSAAARSHASCAEPK
jgi:hypothetical protein